MSTRFHLVETGRRVWLRFAIAGFALLLVAIVLTILLSRSHPDDPMRWFAYFIFWSGACLFIGTAAFMFFKVGHRFYSVDLDEKQFVYGDFTGSVIRRNTADIDSLVINHRPDLLESSPDYYLLFNDQTYWSVALDNTYHLRKFETAVKSHGVPSENCAVKDYESTLASIGYTRARERPDA